MKIKICLLFISVLLITGCVRINNMDYESIAREVVKTKSSTNVSSSGYNVFLPIGTTLVGDKDNNMTIYSEGKNYYLYVDLTSYYYKSDNEYDKDSDFYYDESFNIGDKKAAIRIKKKDDKDYLIIYYNYAKVEVISENIEKDVAKVFTILNNIDYNDIIIKSLVGNTTFDYNERQYNLKSPKSGVSTGASQFLKYEEDYGDYDKVKDEDQIDVKDEES